MKYIKSKILALLTGVGLVYHATKPPVMIEEEKPVTLEKPYIVFSSKPFVELTSTINATTSEVIMINEAITLSNKVMSTECFRNMVLDAKFTETAGLTNGQIYNLIASKKMMVKIEMFNGSFYQNHIAKTMGIDKGDGIVYANRYFIKDAETLGSLILHEAEGHGQGFHHYETKSTSVPYTLNAIYDKCLN